MSGINTDEFMSISFDLQKIALILVIIGFIILRTYPKSRITTFRIMSSSGNTKNRYDYEISDEV